MNGPHEGLLLPMATKLQEHAFSEGFHGGKLDKRITKGRHLDTRAYARVQKMLPSSGTFARLPSMPLKTLRSARIWTRSGGQRISS